MVTQIFSKKEVERRSFLRQELTSDKRIVEIAIIDFFYG